jgi:hypothetical protein
VDVKAFCPLRILMASIFMGGLFSLIGRPHFLWAGLWADYGQNVEERAEQNTKECDENSGRLLADSIFMGGSNFFGRMKLFMGRCIIPN